MQGCDSTATTTSPPATTKTSTNVAKTSETAKVASKQSDNEVADEDDNALPQRIALMPFNAPEDVSDETITMLRQSVFSHLSSTNYLFVRPQEVDQRILLLEQQSNYTKEDASVLTGLLGADALLLGTVLSSDVIYAGVASQIYYKVQVSLVDKTGKVIWSDVFSERSIEGGFSVDPFSMLYNLAVTAMHLGKENMFAVADKIGRQVANSIPQPEGVFTLRNLMIESVVHDGVNKILKYGDTLKVGVKAPANMSVNLSIESISELFSAVETEPGTYFSDIPINTKWNGDDLLLTAYVRDKVGNRARKISHLGLLNIDNKSPDSITDVIANLNADSLEIKWQHLENDSSYSIYEVVNNERVLLQQTNHKSLSISRQHKAFNHYEFEIVATDKAGNTSDGYTLTSEYLPSNALKQSAIINKAKLPVIISSDSRLTKKHSPYLVDNATKIDASAILFIEPGVVLEFTQSGSLEIKGSISTFGLSPIVFKSINDKSLNHSFLKINSEKHVDLNGFIIENAGIAIEVINGKPEFRDCIITNSKYTALSIQNMANVMVDNCRISGSNTSAVVVANNARLRIKNSQFSNNFPFHIQNSSTYSVDARNNQWQPVADAFTILGNVKY